MQIRQYEDADEQGVITLWSAVLPDSAPHNDPTLSLRNKLAVDRDLLSANMEVPRFGLAPVRSRATRDVRGTSQLGSCSGFVSSFHWG